MGRTITIPIQAELTFSEVPDQTRGREQYNIYLGRSKLGVLYKDPYASYAYTLVDYNRGFPRGFHTFEELAKELGLAVGSLTI